MTGGAELWSQTAGNDYVGSCCSTTTLDQWVRFKQRDCANVCGCTTGEAKRLLASCLCIYNAAGWRGVSARLYFGHSSIANCQVSQRNHLTWVVLVVRSQFRIALFQVFTWGVFRYSEKENHLKWEHVNRAVIHLCLYWIFLPFTRILRRNKSGHYPSTLCCWAEGHAPLQ